MPVAMKLPHYGQAVIVFDGTETQIAFRKCTDANGEHFHGHWNPAKDTTEISGVTHWFEIPPPPNGSLTGESK